MKMLATSAVYRRRDPDRQPHADRRQVQERGDHGGAAAERARPVAVVAPALCAEGRARGRLSAVLPLRRDRQRAGLRPREDSVGAGVSARRRRHVAAHLYRDAGELLPEPPLQHPLLVEDGADRRGREPHLRRQTASTRCRRCARRSAASRRSKRPSAGWCRARSRHWRNGRKATPRPTAASCMRRSTGARSTTPRSSTCCARCSAAFRS